MNQTTGINESATNHVSSTSVVLIPEATLPHWAQNLLDDLHPTHTLSSIAQAIHLLKKQKVDAIIAMEVTPPLLTFFQSIEHHRIIRVLVTENFDHEELAGVADVICPPQARYIYHQIMQAVRIKAEKFRLHQEIDSLNTRNQTLQQELYLKEQALNEVELLKLAIVRNVSHELRTPLLQVKSAVAMMSEDQAHNKLLEYAKDATARLEAVVTNTTQLTASMGDSRPSPILLRECVDYALRNLRRSWEHKGNIDRVKLRLDRSLPPVWGDRQGISTVIQQLIDNALKFSQKHVDVSIRRKGERVQIMVCDYGIGISEDQLQAIFQAFYQVDSSSTRSYDGMGVGLAIVQLILERHDEVIHVSSAPDKGSTFTFSLPVVSMETAHTDE